MTDLADPRSGRPADIARSAPPSSSFPSSSAPALTTWRGLPCVPLALAGGDRALVALFGGHVVSWCTADGVERLYMSPAAITDGRTALRGGIPVCFPQFAGRGDLPKHGLARTRAWRCLAAESGGAEQARARLEFSDDEATRALWPQAFSARLSVELTPGALQVELAVENRGTTSFAFTAALHTYLQAAPVAAAAIDGLGGRVYEDSTRAAPARQPEGPLAIVGEVDRIYWEAPPTLTLTTPGRRLAIRQGGGFGDTVVWNPGPERGPQLPDLPAEGWREMLCVEAACIGAPPLLAPGEVWRGHQRLEAEDEG